MYLYYFIIDFIPIYIYTYVLYIYVLYICNIHVLIIYLDSKYKAYIILVCNFIK